MTIQDIDVFWVLICACLVWIMQAGFLCLESGLTRSKNNINVALKNICDNASSIFLFWLIGFSIAFGSPFSSPFSVEDNFYLFQSLDNRVNAFFVFQAVFCSTCCTIVSGAAAERLRFIMYPVLVAIIAGLIYPVSVNMGWGGTIIESDAGFLAQRGFYDFAGSSVVHSTGGWVALALVIIVGPRLGRFNRLGQRQTIQGSNLTLSSLGVLILWFGWLGFNGGSAYSFDANIGQILSNTLIAGAASLVFTLIIMSRKGRRPSAEDLINGALSGLVGITASADCVPSTYAVLIGAGSAMAALVASRLLLHYKIDDVVGAIPVHLAAGIWGTMAVGLFGDLEAIGSGLSRFEQIQVQALGVFTIAIWAFGCSFILIKAVNYFSPLRVSSDDENVGLNISEHGATTELYELIAFMKHQSDTGYMGSEAPTGQFTEVGVIGMAYNHVMDTLRHNEQKLQDMNTRLESANEELLSYDHIVAHDLKNPIAVIRSYASLIEQDELDENTHKQYVARIRKSSEDALAIIKELLNFVKTNSELKNTETVNLHELLYASQSQLEEAISKSRARFELDLKLQEVCFNAVALQQILVNLISNAIKFSANDRTPVITVRSHRKDERDIIEVQDNGIGMNPDQLKQVFNKHSRLHTTTSNSKGSGLGLYNVKKLIASANGDIKVRSIENQGTCFTLSLQTSTVLGTREGDDEIERPREVANG